MKKRTFGIVAATLALTLVGTSAVLGAKGGTDRPIKGHTSGETTVTATGNPAIFTSASEGTNQASHLGKGSYTIAATQAWQGETADECGPGTAIFAVVTGTVEFTAANGAILAADIGPDSIACEADPFNNTQYDSFLNLVVDGADSTGRFAGASGSITLEGHSSGPAGGPFSDVASYTGTISY
jgi:hypothetical protein